MKKHKHFRCVIYIERFPQGNERLATLRFGEARGRLFKKMFNPWSKMCGENHLSRVYPNNKKYGHGLGTKCSRCGMDLVYFQYDKLVG